MTEWLITGSRHGFEGLERALNAAEMFFGRPTRVHVREQRGVDQATRAWVRDAGLLLVPHRVDESLPSPERYHQANQAMVDRVADGGIAFGFPDVHSRGTWDCLRRAHARGLRCYVADQRTRRFRPWQP